MKNPISYLSIIVVLAACQSAPSTEEMKSRFGDFGENTLRWSEVDVHNTPIGKQIQHHPEEFAYLESVDIFSIGHLSDGHLVTGFMVAPKEPGNYPVIIFNRGGNRENGSLVVATAVQIMAPLAAKGYVVMASNYRGNSGSEGQEEFGGADVNDVANLIRSAAEFDKADNSRVGLLGVSRGGMMNFIALRNHPELNIKSVVNIGGVSDLEASIEHHPVLEEVCEELIPGFSENREAELKARSAIYWVDEFPADVPLLLMHSTTDDHVFFKQVEQLADSLEIYSIPYQLQAYADDTHGLSNNRKYVISEVQNWFDRNVKQQLPFQKDQLRVTIQ